MTTLGDLLTAPIPLKTVLNSPAVLPEDRREHYVRVGDDSDDIDIEHVGCPLVEEQDHDGTTVEYDCLARWVTHDNLFMFVHADDPDHEGYFGELGTYRVRTGRWKLDVSLRVYDDPNTGYDEDWTVRIDPAGVVS